MTMASNRQALGIACGVGAGALWGLVFLGPKMLTGFSPVELSAGRYLAYGLASLLLIAPLWRRLAPRVTRADWKALFWLSLAGNIVYFLFLVVAIQKAGIAVASLIVGLVPVSASLFGRGHDSLKLRDMAGPLLVILAGVAAINVDLFSHGGGPDASTLDLVVGVACAVAALLSWTAYAVYNARHLKAHPHFTSNEWSLLTGLVTGGQALLLAPAFFIGASHGMDAYPMFWGVSIIVAIGASVVGNGLWNGASRMLPMSLSGQLIVFETLFALLYGFILEHRTPRAFEWAAIALLMAGILWSADKHRTVPQAAH
ncbi:DMT family transporter [Caulobacter segnis]|nr:DMT family transporter [Caulobacter segnis]MDG2523719.1 DMT family transporter [Caulobacter segnis]